MISLISTPNKNEVETKTWSTFFRSTHASAPARPPFRSVPQRRLRGSRRRPAPAKRTCASPPHRTPPPHRAPSASASHHTPPPHRTPKDIWIAVSSRQHHCASSGRHRRIARRHHPWSRATNTISFLNVFGRRRDHLLPPRSVPKFCAAAAIPHPLRGRPPAWSTRARDLMPSPGTPLPRPLRGRPPARSTRAWDPMPSPGTPVPRPPVPPIWWMPPTATPADLLVNSDGRCA
jgi:hypothetical protein